MENSINFCNININCLNKKQLLVENDSITLVVTVNAESVVRAQKEKRLRDIINKNNSTVDGQVTLWLYNSVNRDNKAEKISGSDFIYDVCKWAQLSNKKIFLLGGNSLSNEMSVRILSEKYRGLKIFGFSPDYSPYPFPEVHNERIMSKLEECAPDILFVGFGMGKQEYWADDNIDRLEKIGIKMIVGCGGTFDFISGRIKRAPKFVQNIGLEGLWRLIMEMKWFRIKRLLLSLKIIPLYIRCHVIKNR